MTFLAQYFGGGSDFRVSLIKGGVGSIVAKGANIILMLLLTILLARSLGVEDFGVYAYTLAVIQILSVPAQFGLPNLVLRETANAHVQGNWARMNGVWRWANFVALGISLLLIAGSIFVVWVKVQPGNMLQINTLVWGLALIPLIALSMIRGAALRGLRHVVLGQMPEQVFRPGFFILLLLVYLNLLPYTKYDSVYAMALHVIAAGLAYFIGGIFLRQNRPRELMENRNYVYSHWEWGRSIIPLALTTGIQVVNRQTDILLLGIFGGTENVGIYKVAVQGGVLVNFGMQAIAMVVTPYFARLYVQKNMFKLQKLFTISVRIIVLLTLPVAIIFIIFGQEILIFIFGYAYEAASTPLAILSVAYILNSVTGASAALLVVTGHEQYLLRSVLLAAATNLAFSLILIPEYGMTGASLAVLISFMVWNIFLWHYTRTKIGLKTTPFTKV